MPKIDSVADSIRAVLRNESLQDATAALADAAASEMLEDIPVLGSLVGLVRSGASVPDQILSRKLLRFLKALEGIDERERIKAIAKIERDNQYGVRVGEQLLYIVDRCENDRKAEIVAWLFAACLEGKGGYDEFLRAANLLDGMYVRDIEDFVYIRYDELEAEDAGPFASTALYLPAQEKVELRVYPTPTGRGAPDYGVEGGQMRYHISDVGRFIRSALRERI